MELDAVHHITCITENGPDNANFYVGCLGLRLVKKTVNFDVSDAYHLYYGDDEGHPGTILTFFEYPNAGRGRAGPGMIHRLLWRVGSEESFEYWSGRLFEVGIESSRSHDGLRFADPEGLEHELIVDKSGNEPRPAHAEAIPPEHRIVGFEGVRAFAREIDATRQLLTTTLGFDANVDGDLSIQGPSRSARYLIDESPGSPGVSGAGTVHHIAWACKPEDQPSWQERTRAAGMDVTEVMDRKYFTSIYFREPSGVLFEIATIGPGFTVDEPLEDLGAGLQLPEWHEHLRARLEVSLRPIGEQRPGQLTRKSA
jgi:glyoxalase family protein